MGPNKENGWLVFKKPELTEGFQQSIFKEKMREGHPRVFHLPMHKSLTGR